MNIKRQSTVQAAQKTDPHHDKHYKQELSDDNPFSEGSDDDQQGQWKIDSDEDEKFAKRSISEQSDHNVNKQAGLQVRATMYSRTSVAPKINQPTPKPQLLQSKSGGMNSFMAAITINRAAKRFLKRKREQKKQSSGMNKLMAGMIIKRAVKRFLKRKRDAKVAASKKKATPMQKLMAGLVIKRAARNFLKKKREQKIKTQSSGMNQLMAGMIIKRAVKRFLKRKREQKQKQPMNQLMAGMIIKRAVKRFLKRKREGVQNHKCSKGHIMKLLFNKPEEYPVGFASCDKCAKEIDYKKGFYHCEECGEDYHRTCLENQPKAMN